MNIPFLRSFYFWAALVSGLLYLDLALLQHRVVQIEAQGK